MALGSFVTGGSAYGTKPKLPTSSSLSTNVSSILNNALGGSLNSLTSGAASVIQNALSGNLTQAELDAMKRRRAEMAVVQGMPGSSNIFGTIQGNASILDPARSTYARQQQGITDLLNLLRGYSGTVAPTYEQAQEQENAIAKYEAAPEPSAAMSEMERIYAKYSNPAIGTGNKNTESGVWIGGKKMTGPASWAGF